MRAWRAQAGYAVPPWLRIGHIPAPAPLWTAPRTPGRRPHMGLAILEPGRTHFSCPRQLPHLSRQRLFPPKAPNPPGHSQNSKLSQMRANEVCYSGLRCCISLSLILCFVTAPFQTLTTSSKKHPSPKLKLSAFPV